jgi:glycerol-3-phosphate acyltransferase PlsX
LEPAGHAPRPLPAPIARRIRVLDIVKHWADCPDKGDVSDWLAAGNSAEKLKAITGVLPEAVFAGGHNACSGTAWPTLKGRCIVLDLGASIGADAESLVDMAVMGSAMSRVLFHVDRPTVGLLNIGVEEVKGLEAVREAGRILREEPLPHMEYVGFVEGDDIGKGTVDVVVTEGFAGNIALKTAEGTARQIAVYLRAAMSRTLLARIGYFLARGAFDRLREKMDPRRVNGGVFLGLQGIVIKSHGGTDAEGFAAAIEIGYSMARNGLLDKINQDLAAHRKARADVREKIAEAGGM